MIGVISHFQTTMVFVPSVIIAGHMIYFMTKMNYAQSVTTLISAIIGGLNNEIY